jgi:uncharacterized membrane protein YeiH
MITELTPTPPLALPAAFEAIAITIGAISGAMHATRRNFDVLGTLAIAFVTGLGGGAIRDILLEQGTPKFLEIPGFLIYAAVGSLIGFLFARRTAQFATVFTAVDVATLGVWVVLGCQKAIDASLPVIGVIFVGVVAAVGGGLLRDLLCGEVPSAFRPGQWNAMAALFAAVTFITFNQVPTPFWLDVVGTIVVAGGLRWLSMGLDIQTPTPPELTSRLGEPRSTSSRGS